MSAPFAMYGGYKYESPEARTLGEFAADKFSYRDQGKNIIQLNNAVGYMSAMMRKMQRGIDEANENFVQQLQGLVVEIITLLGGGGDTGFDWGDLKYVIQAIGALFGFVNNEGEITLPVNLFTAAWHFFSNYIGGTQNFQELIDQIVDGLIATVLDIFGEVPIVGQALQQLAIIISDIRDLLNPIAGAVQELFDALSIEIDDLPGIANYFGVLKPIWDALSDALDAVDLPNFALVLHQIALWTVPFVETIANVINALTYFVNLLTGAQKAEGLQDILDDLNAIFKLDFAVGSGGNIGSGAVDVVGWATAFITDVLQPTGLLAAAQAIINAILPEWLPKVPLSSIKDFNPNLLWNGGFDDPISINPASDFTHDATIGETTPLGSAKVIFDGTDKKPLYGNEIPATAGDTINFVAKVFYDSVVVSGGNALEVYAVAFRDDDAVLEELFIAGVGTNGTAADWETLTGTYTAPTDTAYVAMELKARQYATAGSGWFDNCEISQTPDFKPTWVTELQDRIQNLNLSGIISGEYVTGLSGGTINDDIQEHFRNMVNRFTGATIDPGDTPGLAGADFSMGRIFANLLDNTNRIRDLEAPAVAGGTTVVVNFADYSVGALPGTDFGITYSGSGTASLVRDSNGECGWNVPLNDADRTAKVLWLPDQLQTDYVLQRGTLGDAPMQGNGGSANPMFWAVTRASNDWLNYVFVRGYCTGWLTYKGDMGCVVNGVTTFFAQGIGLTWNTNITVHWGLDGNPRKYAVYSGSDLVYSYTEPSAISVLPSLQTTPANFRWSGFIMEMKKGSSARTAGTMKGFTVADTVAP